MNNKTDINNTIPTKDPFTFKTKLARNKIYWISQITGWSFFVIFNISIISLFGHFSWQRLTTLLYMGLVGVSVTHIFRYFTINRKWLKLPLKKIIPRIIFSSFILGAIIYIIIFTVSYNIGYAHLNKIQAGTVIWRVFNLTGIILVWELIYFSVHFFENYKAVEVEALIWEAAVKDYELKTLKSQLNPHFIFNALNSIRALIKENPESAQTAVTYLSNILRYSLQKGHIETAALDNELQTVTDYLKLESIRFEERLKYKIDIDEGSRQIKIPPMMIQTLIENGIKHGISNRKEGGEIHLSTKLTATDLIIEIRNTGNFDEEALKNAKGFGIKNTKHRLNLIYGEKARFTIENETDEIVLAKIVIPIEGDKNESNNN
ncbi:MAG: histidine kinase [Bacteroidetes bacterium]|nr:histidine kinase [Bacteroidota bacterium]MCH8325597.1 histidine kinase [Bacteroidota bacterium]